MMVVAVCAIALQSCKSGPSEKEIQKEVQGVADNFIKAVIAEDFDKAKELATDGTDKILEQINMVASMIPDSLQDENNARKQASKNATFTFGATTFNEEGTEATVMFTSSQTPDKEESIILKKVDKKWLADMEASMPSN